MTFKLKATYMHIDVPREVMPYKPAMTTQTLEVPADERTI